MQSVMFLLCQPVATNEEVYLPTIPQRTQPNLQYDTGLQLEIGT